MKSFRANKGFSYKDLLYKGLIFVVTVTIIVYFLPKEGKFNYQFDINTPWKYGLLQASFDIPIYKNEKQVQAEQDSIMASYQPYYDLDKQVVNNALSKLREDYGKTLKQQIGSAYLRYIERALTEIYTKGVMSGNDLKRLNEDSTKHILLVEQNIATSHPVSQFYSTKEAYEYLLNADTAYNKQVLQQCNLNNYILPNVVYDEEKSESALRDLLSNISWASGEVLNGQKIIDRGEIIDAHTYNILNSLKKEWEKRSDTIEEKRLTIIGQILFVSLFIICFMVYLESFRKDFYERKGNLSLLFILIIFFPVL